MKKWKLFTDELPTDLQIVWIRVRASYPETFQAQYLASGMWLVSQTTNIYFPITLCYKWREL